MAVKYGNARSIMTSYNGVNGHKAASNFALNTMILRKEWNFTGLVMTDWWAAMNDCVIGGESTGKNISYMIRARNDIYMVVVNDTADKGGFGDNLEESLKNGTLTKAELQLCVKDILLFITETFAAKNELRPLRNEIVLKNKLDLIPSDTKIHTFEEFIEGEELNSPLYYKIDKKAVYNIRGNFVKDGGDTLSQSVTNILLNDEVCGSFECRSTDGKNAYSIASQLTLNPGYYKLTLKETKPGIKVVNLNLCEQLASQITTGIYE